MSVETHCPDRRGEAQHSGLHSIWDEGDDVFPQTSVPVQSSEDVQSMDLRWGKQIMSVVINTQQNHIKNTSHYKSR